MPRRGHRVVTPIFHVTRSHEGFVYHAETIVRTLRLSGFQSQELSVRRFRVCSVTFAGSAPSLAAVGAQRFAQVY